MITLTEKDADFVARKVRDEIESSNEAYEMAIKRLDTTFHLAEEAKKLLSEDESKKTESEFQAVKNSYLAAKEDLTNRYNEDVNTWNKILELLMIGSTDENN